MEIIVKIFTWIVIAIKWIATKGEAVIESIGEDIAKKAFIKAISKAVGSMAIAGLVTFLGGEGIHWGDHWVKNAVAPGANSSSPTPAQQIDYQKIGEMNAQARESTDVKIADLQKMLSQYITKSQESSADKKALTDRIDSLQKQNFQLLSLALSHGSYSNQNTIASKDSNFTDDWITATYHSNGKLEYSYDMQINEVEARLVNIHGMPVELYSIYAQSTRNPKDVKYLGDFQKTIDEGPPISESTQKWYWADWTIHGILAFSNTFEAGAGISPFTWSSGGLNPKNVILRFPVVGITTNFKDSYHLLASVNYNFGRLTGLLKDSYVFVGYSFGTSNGLILGYSTTL